MTQRNSPSSRPVTTHLVIPAFSLGRAIGLHLLRIGILAGLFLGCSGVVQALVGAMI